MKAHQILFVEDDIVTGVSSCEFMRDRGIRVTDAVCARDAITIIDHLVYLTGLVTDVQLGPGQDGFDVARRARVVHPGLPVVYISGTEASRHATEGVEGSVFIGKPYHPRQIVEALIALNKIPPRAPPVIAPRAL
jgi:DNA-binding response OmpR family regulator